MCVYIYIFIFIFIYICIYVCESHTVDIYRERESKKSTLIYLFGFTSHLPSSGRSEAFVASKWAPAATCRAEASQYSIM